MVTKNGESYFSTWINYGLNFAGRRRGVCGSNRVSLNNPVSSSSLDVALFTFFYYSDQFDEWILDDKIGKAYPTLASKEVRTLLRKEILYSLRNAYYCPSASVGRLSKVLFAAQSQPQQFGKTLRLKGLSN